MTKLKITEEQMKQINLEVGLPSTKLINEDVGKYTNKLNSFIKNNINNTKDAINVIKKVLNQIQSLNNKTKKHIIKVLVTTILSVISPDKAQEKVVSSVENSSIDDKTIELFNDIMGDEINNNSEKINIPTNRGNLNDFLNAIAERESSNNWKIFKDAGNYIGKYQFGQAALQDINKNIDTTEFQRNPEIFPEAEQDRAMVQWLKKNEEYLKDQIGKYNGTVINDVPITKSGILAGAHLLGHYNMEKFLERDGHYVPTDGNGVPITDYIQKFNGYNLNI